MEVHKHPLEKGDTNYIQMPKGAKILDFQQQGTTLCMWALSDPAEELELRRFRIYGTGWAIEPELAVIYHGTVQQGPMVWHLFELPVEAIATNEVRLNRLEKYIGFIRDYRD